MNTVVGTVTAFVMALLSAHGGFAQGKFSLSISGAPTYGYSKVNQRLFIPAIGNSGLIPVDFGSRTIGGGYTIGLVGRYAFQPKWSVSTGIWTSYNWANILAFDSSIPAAYSHIGQSHQRNVQVPVLVSFQSSPRRLSPYFSAGALLSFRSPTYVNLKYDQETRMTTGKQAVTVVPTIGVGAIYRMSNHLSLAVQPTVNYYLPQGTYSSYFSGRASLQTQLFYTF